jgi:hypothetical protein
VEFDIVQTIIITDTGSVPGHQVQISNTEEGKVLPEDAQCHRDDAVWLIQPNRNLSWQKTKLAFMLLGLCIAAVAG